MVRTEMSDRLKAKDAKVGGVYESNRSGKFTIISLGYGSGRSVIKFHNTGYIKRNVKISHAINGDVRDPYAKLTRGIGYIGSDDTRYQSKHKEAARAWNNMLIDCERSGYSVSHEWLSFKNFADWYESNATKEMNTLTKSAKSTIYCKQTCRMVTKKESLTEGQRYKMSEITVVDSDGNEYGFLNMREFCTKHNVSRTNMRKLISGSAKDIKFGKKRIRLKPTKPH